MSLSVLVPLKLCSLHAVFSSFYFDNFKFSLVQGLELDDFVSGPRELLIKFVEENYPLPEKPETLPGM